jgi:hypothetical protein
MPYIWNFDVLFIRCKSNGAKATGKQTLGWNRLMFLYLGDSDGFAWFCRFRGCFSHLHPTNVSTVGEIL